MPKAYVIFSWWCLKMDTAFEAIPVKSLPPFPADGTLGCSNSSSSQCDYDNKALESVEAHLTEFSSGKVQASRVPRSSTRVCRTAGRSLLRLKMIVKYNQWVPDGLWEKHHFASPYHQLSMATTWLYISSPYTILYIPEDSIIDIQSYGLLCAQHEINSGPRPWPPNPWLCSCRAITNPWSLDTASKCTNSEFTGYLQRRLKRAGEFSRLR